MKKTFSALALCLLGGCATQYEYIPVQPAGARDIVSQPPVPLNRDTALNPVRVPEAALPAVLPLPNPAEALPPEPAPVASAPTPRQPRVVTPKPVKVIKKPTTKLPAAKNCGCK